MRNGHEVREVRAAYATHAFLYPHAPTTQAAVEIAKVIAWKLSHASLAWERGSSEAVNLALKSLGELHMPEDMEKAIQKAIQKVLSLKRCPAIFPTQK